MNEGLNISNEIAKILTEQDKKDLDEETKDTLEKINLYNMNYYNDALNDTLYEITEGKLKDKSEA